MEMESLHFTSGRTVRGGQAMLEGGGAETVTQLLRKR